jgi:hypothetical protein
MATQTIEAVAPVGNAGSNFDLYPIGSDTRTDTAAATDATTRGGTYTAQFTDVAAGTYKLVVENSAGRAIAVWEVVLTLTTATFYAVEPVTSAEIEAIKVITDQFRFTVANQVDSNTLSGAGSATLANQTALIALLETNPATTEPNKINKVIYNDDTFNGDADKPFMTFAVTLDGSGADSIALVIYDKATPATIYKQVACSATSSLVTASAFDIDFGGSLTFAGCPLTCEVGYAVVATTSSKDATLAFGSMFIINRADPA